MDLKSDFLDPEYSNEAAFFLMNRRAQPSKGRKEKERVSLERISGNTNGKI